jgi:very-short-patch-repair endonuclease
MAETNERAAAAWALVGRQHGVLARKQLLALGFSRSAIEHRLASGRLHSVGAGIYLAGRPESTREGRWMAAVLACGPRAALSHVSAAALWGIEEPWRPLIDVSVRGRFDGERAGIRVRSRPALPAEDIVERNDIPVTGLVRTLLDRACELLPPGLRRRSDEHKRRTRKLERLISEADKRDLIDPERLRAALDDHRGEPGVRPLRVLLDRDTFRLSDSDLEIFFRRIAKRAGLPVPETKHDLNGYEVDFYFPELRLVVETDGLRYHRVAHTQARDLRRDQTHTATGLATLRFSHHQIAHERRYVIAVLRDTVRHLRRP